MAEAEIRRHGVSLSFSAAAQLPAIIGDRVHLQQVILNLVKNAVEAMALVAVRNKTLAVTVNAHGADKVGVAVCDCGGGLQIEMRERIFDAFYTTKAGGMGMGLAISRSIIEAHGGRLWASANEGPGAVFQFALPAGGGRQDSGRPEQGPGRSATARDPKLSPCSLRTWRGGSPPASIAKPP
jgi:signal transduction histidine kinase